MPFLAGALKRRPGTEGPNLGWEPGPGMGKREEEGVVWRGRSRGLDGPAPGGHHFPRRLCHWMGGRIWSSSAEGASLSERLMRRSLTGVMTGVADTIVMENTRVGTAREGLGPRAVCIKGPAAVNILMTEVEKKPWPPGPGLCKSYSLA